MSLEFFSILASIDLTSNKLVFPFADLTGIKLRVLFGGDIRTRLVDTCYLRMS